ncbi:MAG: hypothetical protein M1480_19100, partial [Bacteroidetes bacterium]|nr:hypothetical protein [Bacteroidota bacterium]
MKLLYKVLIIISVLTFYYSPYVFPQLPDKFEIKEPKRLKIDLMKFIGGGAPGKENPPSENHVIVQIVKNNLGIINDTASQVFVPEWNNQSSSFLTIRSDSLTSKLIDEILSLNDNQIVDMSDIPWHYILSSVVGKIVLTDEDKIKWNKPKYKYETFGSFINEYFTLFGGERLGLPIDRNLGIGISFGFGSPYSGPLETNFYEANFHILGASIGAFNSFGDIGDFYPKNNFNNIYSTLGFQASYSFPLSDLLRIQFQQVITDINESTKNNILNKTRVISSDGTVFEPKFLHGNYINFEVRFPISVLAAPFGKIYLADYQHEWHFGMRFYEMSLGYKIQSKFDFRLDYMFKDTDHIRRNQVSCDLLVSNLFESFA